MKNGKRRIAVFMLQNGPAEYTGPEYTLTEPEAENIEWGSFYGAFAAVITSAQEWSVYYWREAGNATGK